MMKVTPADILGSAADHHFLLFKILIQQPMQNQNPSHQINYPRSIGCFRILFVLGMSICFIYSTVNCIKNSSKLIIFITSSWEYLFKSSLVLCKLFDFLSKIIPSYLQLLFSSSCGKGVFQVQECFGGRVVVVVDSNAWVPDISHVIRSEVRIFPWNKTL